EPRTGIEAPELAQLLAIVEEARIEEIRGEAPGLGPELAEAQYPRQDGELDELAAELLACGASLVDGVHGRQEVRMESHSRPTRNFRLPDCAHHHMQREWPARRGPQGLHRLDAAAEAGSRVPAGDQGAGIGPHQGPARAARPARLLPSRAEARL